MNDVEKMSIINGRVELYEDFTIYLLYFIYNNYIDRDSLSEDVDIKNHYLWCFGKACNEFKLEDIDFSRNLKLREYFYTYFYNQFYSIEDNDKISLDYLEKFWRNIFNVNKQKNKNNINALIELYVIFDDSINNRKYYIENV